MLFFLVDTQFAVTHAHICCKLVPSVVAHERHCAMLNKILYHNSNVLTVDNLQRQRTLMDIDRCVQRACAEKIGKLKRQIKSSNAAKYHKTSNKVLLILIQETITRSSQKQLQVAESTSLIKRYNAIHKININLACSLCRKHSSKIPTN